MSQSHVLDGAVAKTRAQADTMWRIREGIAEACGRRGASRREVGVQGRGGGARHAAEGVRPEGREGGAFRRRGGEGVQGMREEGCVQKGGGGGQEGWGLLEGLVWGRTRRMVPPLRARHV